MYIVHTLTVILAFDILGYAFIQLFFVVLLKCLHYVNLVNKSKYFQITRFLYFMLVFNFIMCFLEKDGETSCSKTEMEEE